MQENLLQQECGTALVKLRMERGIAWIKLYGYRMLVPIIGNNRLLLYAKLGNQQQLFLSRIGLGMGVISPLGRSKAWKSSFLITSGVFVVFVLDMASPGYGQFALIPDLRPQIATLTNDVRWDLENLTHSKSSPTATKKTQKQFVRDNCRTLLDAYKRSEVCDFEPTNYSNISR
jgi:hypothetical protein